jgi:hypothetical protein
MPMQVSGWIQVFAAGAFGGLLMEILRWWKLRESGSLPEYSHSLFYWSVTLAVIVGGGVLAVLYGIELRNALMVMNVGASAPALVGALAAPGAVESDGRVTRGGPRPPAGKTREVLHFLAFGG